jgi:hypothetical protein
MGLTSPREVSAEENSPSHQKTRIGGPPISTREPSTLVSGSQLEVVQTHVCRTGNEVLTTGEEWKAELMEKGWK